MPGKLPDVLERGMAQACRQQSGIPGGPEWTGGCYFDQQCMQPKLRFLSKQVYELSRRDDLHMSNNGCAQIYITYELLGSSPIYTRPPFGQSRHRSRRRFANASSA